MVKLRFLAAKTYLENKIVFIFQIYMIYDLLSCK